MPSQNKNELQDKHYNSRLSESLVANGPLAKKIESFA